MPALIVIPARYGSTRLPGKPLLKIAGRTLIERVFRIAKTVSGSPQVVVATDSEQIMQSCQAFGAEAVLTSAQCENGTERVWEVVSKRESTPEIIINLQGDSALMPPWVIADLIDFMQANPTSTMATVAVRLAASEVQAVKDGKLKSGTYVAFDLHKRALYFSRALIPQVRDAADQESAIYKHLGIYGFHLAALRRYVALKPTPLERAEKLEQLRALEHGMPIDVVISDLRGRTPCSVDTAEDAARAEEIIKREGELV